MIQPKKKHLWSIYQTERLSLLKVPIDKTPVNHTIIPITTLVKRFSHVMIAGVDDYINFAGVARNTTSMQVR
jgi:hypothetical protein